MLNKLNLKFYAEVATSHTREIVKTLREQDSIAQDRVNWHIQFRVKGQEGILHDESINRMFWPNDKEYDKVANGKGHLAARTGLSSREAVALAPHLLQEGDSKYAGAIIMDHVIVSVSGFKAYQDEMVARIAAAIFIALCVGGAEIAMESWPGVL